MVPLDRALVSSYRLSIVTMSITAAVWPQFACNTEFPRAPYSWKECLTCLLIPEVVQSRTVNK